AMLLRDARAAGVGADAVRALVTAGIAERGRRPVERVPETTQPAVRPALTAPQREAAARLAEARGTRAPAPVLLHRITRDGKTEVFLAAAEATLAAGRDVLVLVPEIALTHQVVARVRARFGDAVAVLHSGLGPRERWTEWRRIASGEGRVVVGARSAVFAPLRHV